MYEKDNDSAGDGFALVGGVYQLLQSPLRSLL